MKRFATAINWLQSKFHYCARLICLLQTQKFDFVSINSIFFFSLNSPSGIGLASLKQVKDYLLTRGTCKCGLPFPLRVELFFNFNTEVRRSLVDSQLKWKRCDYRFDLINWLCFQQIPTVPLRTPIESIKFDPTCQHRKRITTNQTANNKTGEVNW